MECELIMTYVYAVIGLLAGLGALLLGFKLLSDNIEKMANGKIKKLINFFCNFMLIFILMIYFRPLS